MNSIAQGTVNAFICATPYQVLQAIAITHTIPAPQASDIFLLNHSQGVESLALRLRESATFRYVRVGDTLDFRNSFSAGGARSRLRYVGHSLTHRRTIQRLLQLEDTAYTDVYFTSTSIVVQLALMVLHDSNPSLRIHMYEDGLGSYREGGVDLQLSPWTRAFFKLRGHGFLSELPHEFLVHRPELVQGRMASIASPMPRINWDSRALIAELNHSFGFDPKMDGFSEGIVYFDQPFEHAPRVADLAVDLVRDFPSARAAVKPHPRSPNQNYSGIRVMRNSGPPWELIALNSDIEGKVLVSMSSTACLTPKFIFDLEPQVMLLYRVPEIRGSYAPFASIDRLILDVQSLYRDPSRVSIPSSFDEARGILGSWVR